ncbi:hypothetical protein HRR83_007471 [Exophiala dermatitidis]|uniref:Transcriptional coactivator p15 (PC4) C-terminal domain-containing protein n=2 Tax=Exophiala dermatitidis TaxID=5970 RepID=H6C2G9_EXODN|nr:uncharacterized protein HMPREF1120_06750 [Exophiala dermatitidis NIH/UT8656]KAJ4510445.1 hypothetical protein HRR74_006917 [Exophiala dermatitidis]EHY58747.1 hypothetical protein HMPREF1120_06750 [Exophiala dermatitidis NIH/UT8656]KAJ4510621.1 hypothetical protein HRR73_006693 [Exophiala dermatitidis]KAJ4535055.1 hypothetical protein HRR76_006955 [Exophiala dermatitidis]KAJ4536124.1 hypothetical protein HRR77_007569 [Exophiala dermatitidis]
MGFASKKRKSNAIEHDDSDVDAEVSTKRGKGASGTATTFEPAAKPQTDAEGNSYWEISKNRRVTISDFKGKKLVNIREYYQKDNEWLPGKKGISMSLEQYSALIGIMPQIEELLKQQGESVPRPDYSGTGSTPSTSAANNGADEDQEETARTSQKANIEATSDEDE